MPEVYHAIGLNMHQPLGNLIALHNSPERWEARQILWCYARPTRMLEGYEDVARLHLDFSGTLLKQLEDPGVRETFADVVSIADFLDRYRCSNIEFLGTGLYHPVYPLIPPSDWDTQTAWWLGLGRHLLGRDQFPGLWPPEMGFCMEMIPSLARHGYQYVIVDCWYIKPKRPMRWEELRYRQKKGWDEIRNASAYYQQVKRAFDHRQLGGDGVEVRQLINGAYDRILTAETSCNFFWGSCWVHRSFDELEQAYHLLDTAMAKLK